MWVKTSHFRLQPTLKAVGHREKVRPFIVKNNDLSISREKIVVKNNARYKPNSKLRLSPLALVKLKIVGHKPADSRGGQPKHRNV